MHAQERFTAHLCTTVFYTDAAVLGRYNKGVVVKSEGREAQPVQQHSWKGRAHGTHGHRTELIEHRGSPRGACRP